ncbi:cilia- and flagella-associated protein 100-like [Brachyhypopomus gauderio]|uniref:cilia- and flagella-associated protein 100-like n=1 Tax=Brachyhypopomus gauderio TaxID=698409 RepID=UPI004042AA80
MFISPHCRQNRNPPKTPFINKDNTEEDEKPSSDVSCLKKHNKKDVQKARNPFLLTTDAEIFQKIEEDAITRQKEKVFFRCPPIHTKSTIHSHLRCRSVPTRSLEKDDLPEHKREESRRDRRAWTCHYWEDERLSDYMTKQREMTMVQYSLAVKREIIQKLKNIKAAENHRINLAEKQLQEDATAYDIMIEESNQNAEEAVQQSEKETMLNMEKTAEIKGAAAQIMTIKTEISRYQETLKEFETYKKFLMAATAPQWHEEQTQEQTLRHEEQTQEQTLRHEEQTQERTLRHEEQTQEQTLRHEEQTQERTLRHEGQTQERTLRHEAQMEEKEFNSPSLCSNIKATGKSDHTGKAGQMRNPSTSQGRSGAVSPPAREGVHVDLSDSDEEPVLHFSDPREMLAMITELEEQSLSYIQNFQDAEEAMDEIQKTVQQTKENMNNKIKILQKHVSVIQATIQREREKVAELQLMSKIFSYGEYRADKQDAMLHLLHKKVKEVYKACVGELDLNITTLDMLTNIEYKVGEVLDQLETMPPEKVHLVRSLRNKEKRAKIREEQAQVKKQHQEERLKLAMERAISESIKRTGRKLMPCSKPFGRKKDDKKHTMITRDQQDYLYFFT